jgi:hypothetical protein
MTLGGTPKYEEETLHVQKTLLLLDQPQQLRDFLQETANQMRAEMKLERAVRIETKNTSS